MNIYREDGSWQSNANLWAANGDWSREWETHDPGFAVDPREWGTQSGTYAGSGQAEWWTWRNPTTQAHCTGSWGDDGVGTWSCDDGAAGTHGG